MRVGMLLDAPYPTDVRIAKEVRSLVEAGIEVHLLCHQKPDEPDNDTIDGLHVHRVPIANSLYKKALLDVINSGLGYHPVFYKALQSFVIQQGIDVVHVHDLPLVRTALKLKRKIGVKVVGDFHENYPEALKVWFAWRKNPIVKFKNKLFFNYERWFRFEEQAVKECDHIIAVVDEMKERLMTDHQIPSEKITVVENTEGRNFLDEAEFEEVFDKACDDFVLGYTGNVGPHRGVDTALEGLGRIDNPNIKLIIAGNINGAVKGRLQDIIEQYNLQDRVMITGYIPFKLFPSYMRQANVNVIPHHRNGHTDNTIPHKLFQSMMIGRPVLVSTSSPLKRVVDSTRGGLVFEAGNPDDFAEKVMALYNDREMADKLGDNAKRATYDGTMNWETTSRKLVKLYQDIL
ncbi:MAG: glycosyltransferase family 4 protein [Cyclobacteriaceae bacterium]